MAAHEFGIHEVENGTNVPYQEYQMFHFQNGAYQEYIWLYLDRQDRDAQISYVRYPRVNARACGSLLFPSIIFVGSLFLGAWTRDQRWQSAAMGCLTSALPEKIYPLA